MVEVEALPELVEVDGQRAGIAGIAFEYLDRHRAAVTGAQQAEHDLQLVALAIAAVATPCQWTGAALEPCGSHVVQHQGSPAQLTLREAVLDA